MTQQRSKLEIIPLLVNGYIKIKSKLLMPNDIIGLIIKFHGYYDISFKSNILISTKDRIKFMELIHDNININDIQITRIFSGKTHGFSSKTFHNKCDNKTHNISLILNENNCIFGGYTSKCWLKNFCYQTDPNAFLYKLKPNDIKIFKPKRQIKGERAIFSNSNHMCNYDHDLIIRDNCNIKRESYCNPCSYNVSKSYDLVGGNITINNTFIVKDIEMFVINQISK